MLLVELVTCSFSTGMASGFGRGMASDCEPCDAGFFASEEGVLLSCVEPFTTT